MELLVWQMEKFTPLIGVRDIVGLSICLDPVCSCGSGAVNQLQDLWHGCEHDTQDGAYKGSAGDDSGS